MRGDHAPRDGPHAEGDSETTRPRRQASAEHHPPWRDLWRRGPLERALATVVGGALGGVLSVVLVFEVGVVGPILWLPVALGAATGYYFGDRAVHAIIRFLEIV